MCLEEFDLVLHLLDRTQMPASQALELFKHANKFVAIFKAVVRDRQAFFPVGFQNIIRFVYQVVLIHLFVSGLGRLLVDGSYSVLQLVLP